MRTVIGIVAVASLAIGLLLVPRGSVEAKDKTPVVRVPQDFDTIQEAIDNAPDGARISVRKGEYAPFTLTDEDGLTLIGKGKPVIDGGGGNAVGITLTGCANVTVRGFVIENVETGLSIGNSTLVTVSKCRVEGATLYGMVASASSEVRVEKCRVNDTGTAAVLFGVPDPVADSSVFKTRVATSGRGGIIFGGAGNTADKNRVTDADRHAFETQTRVFSQNNKFTRNRATGGDAGIRIHGADNELTKNRCTGSVEAGVHLHDDATGTLIEKQVVKKAVTDGLLIEGSTTTVTRAKISKPGRHGVNVVGADNDFDRTKVSKAGGDGFNVSSGGNTFDECKAKKSEGFDLNDFAGPGANTYEDSTKFGTTSP